ncbi:MAG: tyrosine-type recombinase/integrase [Erysipelotrichaceae bacterium]|nr:tyrosine-type recombinase/integrase [Erysipelotrichaceae bacterium]
MRKEKYIEEKYSESKADKKKSLVAFVVNMPLPNGEKFYQRFRIKDYVNAQAAFKDAVKVRDRKQELIRQSREGKISFENYTVQELYDLIPSYFDRRLKTYMSIDIMYNKYIKGLYGSTNITDITEEDILITLRNCSVNCGANYVSKVKSVWKKIFIIAQRKRIIQVDLTALVENPRSENVTERSLSEQNITEEDFQVFCEAMSKYGHYLPSDEKRIYNRNIMLYMLKLMRITGIRSQEARALRRENIKFVDIDGKTIVYVCVRKSIGSSKTKLNVEVSTKTPHSVRNIPIGGDHIRLINEILEYSKHDLLFSDYKGDPFSTEDFADYLYRVSRSCGIKVYPLLMRKSFSADLYAQGTNPAITRSLMGHKEEDMSLNAYATASQAAIIDTALNRKFKKQ